MRQRRPSLPRRCSDEHGPRQHSEADGRPCPPRRLGLRRRGEHRSSGGRLRPLLGGGSPLCLRSAELRHETLTAARGCVEREAVARELGSERGILHLRGGFSLTEAVHEGEALLEAAVSLREGIRVEDSSSVVGPPSCTATNAPLRRLTRCSPAP